MLMEIRRNVLFVILAALVIMMFTGCPSSGPEPANDPETNGTTDPENGGDPSGDTSPSADGPQISDYLAAYTGADAEAVGSDKCTMCHSDKKHGEGKSHVSVFEADESNPMFGTGCEACHGPGGEHNGDKAGILMPLQMSQDEVIDLCTGCHASKGIFELEAYQASKHYSTGNSCLTCHSGHSENEKFLNDAEPNHLCAACHAGVVDGMAAGDHGIPDGVCKDCHNPHKDM